MSPDDEYNLRDFLEAKFSDIERRLDRIEEQGPRAGVYGAAGTAIGGAIVAVLSYFGLKPQ